MREEEGSVCVVAHKLFHFSVGFDLASFEINYLAFFFFFCYVGFLNIAGWRLPQWHSVSCPPLPLVLLSWLGWLEESWAVRLRCPRGEVHLDLSHHFFFFPKISAIRCNVALPCHFPTACGPSRRWVVNDVGPRRSDGPHTVASSPPPRLFAFPSALLMWGKESRNMLLRSPRIMSRSVRLNGTEARRRLSLMETNVDTSHPKTCSQLTRCLIKVIYGFIYERLKAAVKWVHAALTLQSGLLLYFHLDFNGNNLL